MGTYYLDIETTGLDETKDKIITIQYAELERNTGRQIGDLKVFTEWESGEAEMLERFIESSAIQSPYRFDFVPVGYNLAFEEKFLRAASGRRGGKVVEVFDRPHIDLRHIGVLMNRGEFKNSGLDKLTGKKHDGTPVPEWYEGGDHASIIKYVRDEAEAFIHFFTWLNREMPQLRKRYNQNEII